MRTTLLFVLCLSVGACDGASSAPTCPAGTSGCACLPSAQCNAGLDCEAGRCVVDMGPGDGAAGDPAGGDPQTSGDAPAGDALLRGDASSGDAFSGDTATCSESPCKLVGPQCGCEPGQKCTVGIGNQVVCGPAGTKLEGELCIQDNECQAELSCVTAAGVRSCRRFCASDNDCNAPGGLCLLELGDGAGGLVAELCTDACDPITAAGCISPNKCAIINDPSQPDRYATLCAEAGASTQATPCSYDSECAAGYLCISVAGNSQCLQYCNLAQPNCAIGSCVAAGSPMLIGTVEYGVCL